MQINGIDVDFNIFDTNQLKIFELGINNVKKEIDGLDERVDLMIYEKGELCCKLVTELINDLFGVEKGNEIITNKNDMMLCVSVLAELIELSNEIVKTNNQKLEKYSLKRLHGKHFTR